MRKKIVLTPEELDLLINYRRLTEEEQRWILERVRVMKVAQAEEEKRRRHRLMGFKLFRGSKT